MLMKTFRETAVDFEYTFFVGVDDTDAYYIRHKHSFEADTDVRIVPVRVEHGYVTHIWNILAKIAYDDGYDYMFQCGDDVRLETKGWVRAAIHALASNGNVGVTGPRDRNNLRLLTQTFVHRTHYELFRFYFPPEIPNWFCDDWINEVYTPLYLPPEYTCFNTGGKPRYTIVECRDLCTRLVRRDKKLVNNLLAPHQ